MSGLSSSAPGTNKPLDPPPACFSIPSPMRIKSHDFPTFRIPAVSDNLTDRLCTLYPCDTLETHGIDRADWFRFINDLAVAARLSSEGQSAIGSRLPIAPLIAHGVFPLHALGAIYDGHFAQTQEEEVRALIRIWNQCAFERRKVRVTLEAIESSGKKSYVLVVESL